MNINEAKKMISEFVASELEAHKDEDTMSDIWETKACVQGQVWVRADISYTWTWWKDAPDCVHEEVVRYVGCTAVYTEKMKYRRAA
jgi:hypothetical protein